MVDNRGVRIRVCNQHTPWLPPGARVESAARGRPVGITGSVRWPRRAPEWSAKSVSVGSGSRWWAAATTSLASEVVAPNKLPLPLMGIFAQVRIGSECWEHDSSLSPETGKPQCPPATMPTPTYEVPGRRW